MTSSTGARLMSTPSGGLDALIAEGMAMQGTPVDLERLIQEGMQDVLSAGQGAAVLQPIPEGVAVQQPALAAADGLQQAALHMQQQQHQPDLHAHPAAGFERDVASQVHSGTGAPRGQAAAGEDEEEVEMDESGDEQEGGDAGGENETGSSGKPARGVKRKKTARQRNPQAGQGMQGRFSGRLETKEDERRLADECKLLGPLLSDSTAGDRALQTLAKIVRGIASGEVRQHVEARERELQELRRRLVAMQQAPDHKVTVQLQEEVSQLRAELQLRAQQLATLERELASANSRLQTVAAAATGQPPPPPLAAAPAANVALAAAAAQQQQQQQAAAAAAAVAAVAAPVSVALPVGGAAAGVQLQVPLVQAQPSALPLPALAAVPVAQPPQPQAMLSTSLPAAVQLQQATNSQQQQAAAQQQAVAAAAAQATIQQQQVVDALAGQPKPAQPLNGTLPGVAQQLVTVPQATTSGAGIQLVLQPAAPASLHAGVNPPVTTLSGQQVMGVVAPQPAMTVVQQVLPSVPAATQALSGDVSKPLGGGDTGAATPAVQQEAAVMLQDHVQHLAVQATLHGQAKNQAESQAQQLAQQANLHAQASVQAAAQAEQLKKTLAVLPDTDHSAQQAVATVESLEARAQAHAEITAQAVQQAQQMQEQAQAHAQEQAKAIAQATILQVQAQTLQVEAPPQQPLGLPSSGAMSSGADAAAPLLAAVPAPGKPAGQSALSSGPPSMSLGGPSDMQMAHELGLLPTSPLSSGNNGAGALLTCTAASAGAPPTSAALPATAILQHPQQQQQPAAAMAVPAQLLAAGGGQVVVVPAQQQPQQAQQAVPAPTVVGVLPSAQVQASLVNQPMLAAHPVQQAQLLNTAMAPAPQPVVVIQGQPGLSGVTDASSLLQQQQQPAAAPAAVAVQPQAATPTQQLQEHFVALQQAQQQQQATQQLQDQLVVLQHAQQQQLATQQQASSAAQEQLAVAAQAQQQQQQMAAAAAIVQGQIAALQSSGGPPTSSVQAAPVTVTVVQHAQPEQQAPAGVVHAAAAVPSGLPPVPPTAATSSVLQPLGLAAGSVDGSRAGPGTAGGSDLGERTMSTRGSVSLAAGSGMTPPAAPQPMAVPVGLDPVQQQQAAAAPAPPPLQPPPGGPTGLTPQVGTLDLPPGMPGMEALLPSVPSLPMDSASLNAAAAMAPVVSIPSDGQHQSPALLPVTGTPPQSLTPSPLF